MSLPEPRENPDLFGHEAAEATLLSAARAGRLHHAWLLLGPPGIGKATLAFRFARRLLAGLPATGDTLALPAEHPVFRRVAAGSHADLLTVELAWDEKRKKRRSEIVVDDVRSLNGFLHLTPAEGGWRVVIIDGAEALNRNAANALLKLLEEPPPRALLLLVCAAVGALPVTVRSRCRRLRLDPLPSPALDRVLTQALPDHTAAARARLAGLAAGSAGQALRFAEEGALALRDQSARALADPMHLELPETLDLADSVVQAREEGFSTFMDCLRAGLADAVRAAGRGVADATQHRLLGSRGLAEWVAVWQALGSLQRETEDLHLEKREALVQAMRLLAVGAAAWEAA